MVLGGCFLIGASLMAYTLAPASLIPLVVDEFGINKAAAGLTISAVYVSWLVLQIPGGLIIDRYDNRHLVFGSVALLTAASVAGYFVSSYSLFLITRLIGGASAVFVWTASANIVNRVFPASRRAFGTSVFVASGPVGIAISQFGGPLIAAAAGWQAVLLVYPAIAVVGLPFLYLVVRRPIRNETRLEISAFVRALREPTIVAVSASAFCAYSLLLFFSSWMPTYGTEVLSLDLAAAGATVALVPIAGVFARPGGGWLSDWLNRRRLVIVVGFLLTFPAIAGANLVTTIGGFGVTMVVAGVATQLGIGVFYAYAGELAESGAGGTSFAVLTAASVAGALVTPVLVGWLVEAYSWGAAFGFAALITVLGLVVVLLLPES